MISTVMMIIIIIITIIIISIIIIIIIISSISIIIIIIMLTSLTQLNLLDLQHLVSKRLMLCMRWWPATDKSFIVPGGRHEGQSNCTFMREHEKGMLTSLTQLNLLDLQHLVSKRLMLCMRWWPATDKSFIVHFIPWPTARISADTALLCAAGHRL